MNKLNKRGITLVEMLASIVLLGVVMISSYAIVSHLLYVKNNATLAVDNSINRALIIDAIQNDLVVYGLSYDGVLAEEVKITEEENSIVFHLTSYKGKSMIVLSASDLVYIDPMGIEAKWSFAKNSFSSVELDLHEYYDVLYNGEENTALIQIKIPIYTNHPSNNGKNKNNVNDDIIITYYGPYINVD